MFQMRVLSRFSFRDVVVGVFMAGGVWGACISSRATWAAEKYAYDLTDTSCDGFPQLPIETAPGLCVGLVLGPTASDPTGRFNMLLPRRLLPLSDGQGFLLSDLGRWDRAAGRIWWVRPDGKSYGLSLLFAGLSQPHGLALGPDNKIYVGLTDRVARFAFKPAPGVVPGTSADLETVFALPDRQAHAHPLTQIDFLDARTLLVTLGSPSNDCAAEAASGAACTQRDAYAAVLHYRWDGTAWRPTGEREAGLRNPLALTHHSSGSIWAADNAIDDPSDSSPLEPIFRLEQGHSYGWPYCINDRVPRAIEGAEGRRSWSNPSCEKEDRPIALLPAHVAPLDMAYAATPFLTGEHLIMSWHGYRPTGSKVIAIPVDAKGTPLLRAPDASPTVGSGNSAFVYPGGGNGLIPQWTELISRWDFVSGVRPRGTPVGVTPAADGSLWLTEDQNRTVLRIARGGRAYSTPQDTRLARLAALPALKDPFRKLVTDVLRPRCGGCHQQQLNGDDERAFAAIVSSGWLSEALPRISKDAKRPMPPTQPLAAHERALIGDFVKSVPR